MKIPHYTLAALLGLSVVTWGPACAEGGDHAHHGHGSAGLVLDHGRKWQTDASLRSGMEALRAAYAGQLPAIHAGKLSAAAYRALGEKTESTVGRIVAECKLEANADAVLHVIVADLLAGAELMTGKTKGRPQEGAHRVVAALANYGRYFDHPGWQGLE